MIGIFWFRRDLRHIDNTALNKAFAECSKVVPVFVLDPRQIDDNKFKSERAVTFMIESLQELSRTIPLVIKYGNPAEEIPTLAKTVGASRVYCNRDYTKFSQLRDTEVRKALGDIDLCEYEDILVNYVDKPYLKFTPFYNYSKQYPVRKPTTRKPKPKQLTDLKQPSEKNWTRYALHKGHLSGGRTEALKLLNKIPPNYDEIRNDLSRTTTMLSAYIKFGCISIREVYQACRTQEPLIRQLYWRDFYYLLDTPLVWITKAVNKRELKKWQEGQTGYPIVDAGMRQLNQTGYMHNRARLITSDFLTKLLGINWEEGELYYARQLQDYDPLINSGNWQWVVKQPRFRTFNPWLQSLKFDRNAEYIKKWIPALGEVPAEAIHKWYETHPDYDVKYPKPMIDYKKAKNTKFV